MAWLNYHHLLYFWTVAREGSIARASEQLRLTQPAISAQVRTLETALGEKLFAKSGRNLVLTDFGRMVFRYADEIFTIGRELTEVVRGRAPGRPARLLVGVTDAVPKLITSRLLEPALKLPEPVRIVLREDKLERLIADLAIHALDLVLTDVPAAPTVRVRAYNHLLGECGVSFFAAPRLIPSRRRFPQSLDGAPFVLPTQSTALRRSLDAWFDRHGIHPDPVAEIEDSAVLKLFGEAGVGVFAAPSAIEREVKRHYAARVVGRADDMRQRFYAISTERRLTNPAARAITEGARGRLQMSGVGRQTSVAAR